MGQKLTCEPSCEICGEKITNTEFVDEFEIRANTKGRLIMGSYSRAHLNEYIETIYHGYCDNKHMNIITKKKRL